MEISQNCNQESNLTKNGNITKKQEKIKLAKINWIYQENKSNHHRIKYQAPELYDKNLDERIIQENSLRTHKIHQSKGKFTPIIFINSALAKISQKCSQTYQNHIVIFGIFCKKFRMNRGFK